MNKIIESLTNLNKLSLPATILIATIVLGGFYYVSQVNKLKYDESQQKIKINEEKAKANQTIYEQAKLNEEKDKDKQALNSCLVSASSNYSENWYRACKSQGKLTDRCISLHDMTFDEYAKQNNIPEISKDNTKEGLDKRLKAIDDFYKQRDECLCLLPFINSDRIEKTRQADKDECFKQYPQNK